MHKVMTKEQLAALKAKGAKLNHEPDKPTELAGMTELVERLTEIASSQQLKLEQKRESIRDVLEALVKVMDRPATDMKPIVSLLSSIAINTKAVVPERCAYKHDIQRNSKGDMTGIISTPDPKSIN